MTAVIETRDVWRVYGTGEARVNALAGFDLTVEPGEFVAIMGASGSGKSTAMNILGLLDEADSGTYIMDGIDVGSMDSNRLSVIRNRKIGFVFQSFNLITRINALRNVELPMLYAGVHRREARRRAMAALDLVGLVDRVTHLPTELSGGQQQRVALARALVNSPSLILADEPTGNLDSASASQVLDVLTSIHRAGRTIVLITHDRDVASHADRIAHMKDGQVVALDTRRKSAAAATAVAAPVAEVPAPAEVTMPVPPVPEPAPVSPPVPVPPVQAAAPVPPVQPAEQAPAPLPPAPAPQVPPPAAPPVPMTPVPAAAPPPVPAAPVPAPATVTAEQAPPVPAAAPPPPVPAAPVPPPAAPLPAPPVSAPRPTAPPALSAPPANPITQTAPIPPTPPAPTRPAPPASISPRQPAPFPSLPPPPGSYETAPIPRTPVQPPVPPAPPAATEPEPSLDPEPTEPEPTPDTSVARPTWPTASWPRPRWRQSAEDQQ